MYWITVLDKSHNGVRNSLANFYSSESGYQKSHHFNVFDKNFSAKYQSREQSNLYESTGEDEFFVLPDEATSYKASITTLKNYSVSSKINKPIMSPRFRPKTTENRK